MVMTFTASRAVSCAITAIFGICLSGSASADEKLAHALPGPEDIAATAAAKTETAKPLRTRFVIGLDKKPNFEVFSLTNPNRVVVELSEVGLRLPEISNTSAAGLVRAVRGGLAAPGKMRVVIDVSEPVVIEKSELTKEQSGSYRLALDITPFRTASKSTGVKPLATPPSGLGAGSLQPPLPKRAENPRARAARAFRPVIILDPGHGGMDTGAKKFGTVEKHVVLAFSHELRKQLEKTGRYKILMTRETDEFIELDERLEFGERHKANLFIAVHADYAGTRARGATIYTLRDRVARDLQRSSKGRSGRKVLSDDEIDTVRKTDGDVDTVRDILSDLAERDVELTQERTSVFAKSVIEFMGESTPMRDEPDKQAAFRVLKTAQFPSVLIELAYVSNRQDASNLNSDEWREKVADSIVTAIDNYFSDQVAHLPM